MNSMENPVTAISNSFVATNGLLNNPGDQMTAVITKTGRKVVKYNLDNGMQKIGATQYPNGTMSVTITLRSSR